LQSGNTSFFLIEKYRYNILKLEVFYLYLLV